MIFSLIILIVSISFLIGILQSIFCTKNTQELCNLFGNYIPSIIEVSIGIGIALLIHNHARNLQEKDDQEVKLTIHGIYLHLWSLYLASIPYINSAQVRKENTTTIQILNLINHSQTDLSKCTKLISGEIIEKLQLHLVLIRTAISISLDPRSNAEEYWKANTTKVKVALEGIKNIAKEEFEKHFAVSQKIVWKDID